MIREILKPRNIRSRHGQSAMVALKNRAKHGAFRSLMSRTMCTALMLAMSTTAVAADQRSMARQGDWVTPAVSAPGVTFGSLSSPSIHGEVSFHVYLPPDYATNESRRYPTLYWLHGSGGGLRGIPVISALFDAAIRQGKIPPMIVVFPNGLPEGMWTDSADGQAPVETMVVDELLPLIDRTYRTIASRRARILEGFSMGGYGAGRIGFRRPDLFASISMLAAGPLDLDLAGPQAVADPLLRQRLLHTVYGDDIAVYRAQSPWTIATAKAATIRKDQLLRQVVGSDDFTAADNRAFHRQLTKLKIPHEFRELPGIRHDARGILSALGEENWRFYRAALANY